MNLGAVAKLKSDLHHQRAQHCLQQLNTQQQIVNHWRRKWMNCFTNPNDCERTSTVQSLILPSSAETSTVQQGCASAQFATHKHLTAANAQLYCENSSVQEAETDGQPAGQPTGQITSASTCSISHAAHGEVGHHGSCTTDTADPDQAASHARSDTSMGQADGGSMAVAWEGGDVAWYYAVPCWVYKQAMTATESALHELQTEHDSLLQSIQHWEAVQADSQQQVCGMTGQ